MGGRTKVDAQPTKINAAAERPTSPSWHRKGWKSYKQYKDRQREDSSASNTSVAALGKPFVNVLTIPSATAQHNTTRSPGEVYAHHNRHTHFYSSKQFHTHRTTLHMSWVPGMNGADAPVANHRAFCGELDDRLYFINNTLNALKAKAAAIKANEKGVEGDWDTAKLRDAVNSSVTQQSEFFAVCMSEWCKLGYMCYRCQCKELKEKGVGGDAASSADPSASSILS